MRPDMNEVPMALLDTLGIRYDLVSRVRIDFDLYEPPRVTLVLCGADVNAALAAHFTQEPA